MFHIRDQVDLQALSESAELEFKLAQGKDGKGKLPDDFWPTYSAMANSRGGYVVLGVRERKGVFSLEGIEDIEVVRKQLFDIAGNSSKVNINLLTNHSVQAVSIEGKQLLVIEIPAARREQKPVYLKNQPMKETFIRLHEGDHRCSEEQVKRMMAEQVESSRDDKILTGYDFNDISLESLSVYKNLFVAAKPQHPWLELELFEMFKKLGGWVNHERACQLTSKHSRDVTLTLPRLVDKGFLVANGIKKDKSYSLPGMELPSPEDVFSNALTSIDSLTHNVESLTHSDINLTHNDSNDQVEKGGERDSKGRFISEQIDKPFVDELNKLAENFRLELNALGAPARKLRRLDADTMKQLIGDLCKGHYISGAVLEALLDRKAQSLRQNYLKPMVSAGDLKMAFPHKPNSPMQGYTTSEQAGEVSILHSGTGRH